MKITTKILRQIIKEEVSKLTSQLKESKTVAQIMKDLEAHGWDQKEFVAISGAAGAYGDDLTPEERTRLQKKYDELVKKDAVKALLKQRAQAKRAERKGK